MRREQISMQNKSIYLQIIALHTCVCSCFALLFARDAHATHFLIKYKYLDLTHISRYMNIICMCFMCVCVWPY